MPSATGSIKAFGSNKFVAAFDVDGETYMYSGNTDSSVPSFASASATLAYGEKEELIGMRKYNASIKGAAIIIRLENGPSIQGTLDTPGAPDVAYDVADNGFWGRN